MLTFRPYGACILVNTVNYKHFAPTGLRIPATLTCFEHHAMPCNFLACTGIIISLLNKWAWPTFFIRDNGRLKPRSNQ